MFVETIEYFSYESNILKQLQVAFDEVKTEEQNATSLQFVNRESILFQDAPQSNPEALLELVVCAMRHYTLKQEKKESLGDLEEIVTSLAKADWFALKTKLD